MWGKMPPHKIAAALMGRLFKILWIQDRNSGFQPQEIVEQSLVVL